LLAIAAETGDLFAQDSLEVVWGGSGVFADPDVLEQGVVSLGEVSSETQRVVFIYVLLVKIEEEIIGEFHRVG
jgi:hypothetical protein